MLPTTSYPEEMLEWYGEVGYMGGYESDEVYDTTCDILCHRQGEWDGYHYQDKWVCLCGSGNGLSTVGGDWFNEDGWHWMSYNGGHPGGGLTNKNIIDEDAPKKRIWRNTINTINTIKPNNHHKPVRAHSLIRSLPNGILSITPTSKEYSQLYALFEFPTNVT